MKQLFLFFILFQYFFCNAINCDSLKIKINEKMGNLNIESIKCIDSLLLIKHNNCIDNYFDHVTYKKISAYFFEQKNIEKAVFYRSKGISFGYWDTWNFLDEFAFYLKDEDFANYIKLRRLADSTFIEINKSVPNLNKEVSLLLRYMVINDQEVRQKEILSRKKGDSTVSDSLLSIMKQIDLENEFLLSIILDKYGYPGYSMVGRAHGEASLMFFHMSLNFQEKYVHLVVKAYLNKELLAGENTIKALIDRILYYKFKKTIYHTDWGENIYTNDPDEINNMLIILNIPKIK